MQQHGAGRSITLPPSATARAPTGAPGGTATKIRRAARGRIRVYTIPSGPAAVNVAKRPLTTAIAGPGPGVSRPWPAHPIEDAGSPAGSPPSGGNAGPPRQTGRALMCGLGNPCAALSSPTRFLSAFAAVRSTGGDAQVHAFGTTRPGTPGPGASSCAASRSSPRRPRCAAIPPARPSRLGRYRAMTRSAMPRTPAASRTKPRAPRSPDEARTRRRCQRASRKRAVPTSSTSAAFAPSIVA